MGVLALPLGAVRPARLEIACRHLLRNSHALLASGSFTTPLRGHFPLPPLPSRCFYCEGTGYLMCGHCVGSGIDPLSKELCPYCAGSSKVMCTSCLCTGKQLATEHDPRIDPF